MFELGTLGIVIVAGLIGLVMTRDQASLRTRKRLPPSMSELPD